MKMKKSFLIFLTVLIGLFTGVGTAKAGFDIAAIFASLGSLTADDLYYVQLKANPSPAASGEVQLMLVDMMGDTIDTEDALMLNPGASGNTNPTGYMDNPQLAGTTVLYGDMEAPLGNAETHVYVTSFAYFKAEARPADGWYFDNWSYIDNGQILQLDTLRSGEEIYWPTEENPNTNRAVIFKIKPHDQKGTAYLNPAAVGQVAYDSIFRYVTANFKPVLLTGYSGGKSEIVEGNASTTIEVVVNIDAKKDNITTNDFNIPTLANTADFSLIGMAGDMVDGKPVARLTIKYQPTSFTVGNFYKTNLTVSTKGGSTIVIPLEVRAVAADRTEATLYNADGSVAKDGALEGAEGVLAAITGTDQVLQLNQDYAGELTFAGKTFTFDLNGYNAQALTINSGDVTLAYSRFGGSLTSINVAGGKLTLNGGTIEASGEANVTAVTVAAGATLIQNGATIKATSASVYAIGINVDGMVTMTNGSIKAHADYTAAFAVQVGATGKLTITGGALNASVNQTHTPIPDPANQETWSNAYAVYVTDASGVANIEGGSFYSTSSYDNAFAVCALATFGKMTIGKKAIVSAHTVRDLPVAYAVGSMGAAVLTVNGGRFSATYTKDDVVKPCPPFLCAGFDKLQFKSGIIKADSVYVRDAMFAQTATLVQPTLFNIVRGSQDYLDGYRYIAVDESRTTTVEAGVPACRIGTTGYAKLEDAIAYANNNPSETGIVIMMINDYTLPAGYYTLPANATIVVPKNDNQNNSNSVVERTVKTYVKPTEFRRLTFASGVKMEVFGAIEVSGTQHAYDTGNGGYNSNPWGPYGLLVLEEGTKLTMQDGAHVYAWGFVIGKGELDVRRGAIIHEQFQMGDWKGGTTSFGMLTDERGVFPVTQYWIQNVESPAKFHPGAILTASAAVSVGSGMITAFANDINIVGVNGRDDAMFLLDNEADAENTWVYKWYDVENDLQVYEVNNTAHIGSIVLKLGKLGNMNLDMNSALFKLPITNNMKIHLLSGFMDFTQDTYLLPGAEVEVDKESIVSITTSSEEGVHSGSLYIYDADDWGNYIIDISGGKKFTKAVLYEPITDGRPAVRPEKKADGQKDASILVHGQFDTNDGYIYTSAGGANIYSTNADAGTFSFKIQAKPADYTENVYHADGTTISDSPDVFYPAKLKNGNGEFTGTGGTGANLSYCYMNDEWQMLYYFDCYAADVDMETYATQVAQTGNTDPIKLGKAVKHIFIKPQEWVEIAGVASINYVSNPYDPYLEGVEGNADYTYSDAAGAGRLFINVPTKEGNCQWWEVEKKDNLYHCVHPLNDTYYYWDNSAGEWKEQRYTISWLNWNGDTLETIGPNEVPVKSYSVTYGTQAEYLGTNPTREANIDYTYDFTGWNPTPGKVTSDVTYTATYEQKDRMYTIIFQQEGGVEIERQFLKHNDVPVCENTPTKVGHTLVWSPAVSPVIGDQTYVATWLEEPPTEWDVTFVNNANGVLQATAPVGVNEHPVYSGSTPAKENADHSAYSSNEYTYTFWGWSAVIDGVARQFEKTDELPCPTAPTTYTAVYTEAPQLYTVTFRNENNSVRETNQYQYGEMPVCSDLPTKDATAEYTYKLVWTPQIQTVMGNATYTATFPGTKNKYTVTLKSNPSGACTLSGAGIYEYNTSSTAVTISLVANEGYDFTGWSDGQGGTSTTRQMAITGDINLVANFTVAEPDYTITWKSEDGLTTLAAVGQKSGTATTYTGATPTKDATSGYTYAFDGWTTQANGRGTYYKNGMTPKATKNATYYAHFAATAIPSLEIDPNGLQVLTEPVTYQNLVLTSNGVTSGQLLGQNYLTLTGNAYFDLAINAQNHTWYAIAVPWEVDAESGISVNGRTLTFGKNFDILYYDGAQRAANGADGSAWKYMEDDFSAGNRILEPGKLYMIGLTGDASVIRFAKKAGAPLLTNTTSVSAYGSANALDAGWNGIANPAIFHAYVNAGVTTGQVYDANTGGYSTITLSSTKLVLGQPVFVQVSADKDITVSYGGTFGPASAPRRAKAGSAEVNYEIRIAPMGAQYTDRLFIATDEDKEAGKYVICKDLAKMGVSSAVAQMWVNNYNTKLCMNTVAPIYGVAEYPLGIYAPQAGEYQISNAKTQMANEDYELYLTYDGEAIWNLNRGAYTLELNKGTITNYGLRVSARKAPEVATGFDEAIVDSKDATAAKVLIGNQVFIIRGDKVYAIDGQLVK